MKRRQSPLPVAIYKVHCEPPVTYADEVERQYALGHKYRNRLVEIELERRKRYREAVLQDALLTQLKAEELELAARLEELRTVINAARGEARKRINKTAEAQQAKEVRASLRANRDTARVLRAEMQTDPRVVAAAAAIEKWAHDEVIQARANCGAYWGTYLLAEQAADQARKSRTDPRFKSFWYEPGRIGVQIQGGVSAAQIMQGQCTQLQIELDADRADWSTRSARRHARGFVHFRIGSDDSRRPIFAKFPAYIWRPLPSDATVKSAVIVRQRVARKYVYQLQICLEAASVSPELRPGRALKSAPVAAINFGWRIRHPDQGGGLRVGVVVDELGETQELVLPQRVLGRLDRSNSLASIRTRNLDDMRPILTAALRELELPPTMPLAQDIETMHAWRSADRFSRLLTRWTADRFAGDAGAFEILREWHKQDLHLLQWQEHSSANAYGLRRQVYLDFAGEMGRKYSVVVFDQFDLRRVARSAKPEDSEDEAQRAVTTNRRRASISLARTLIGQRVPVVALPAFNNTHVCCICRQLCRFDAQESLLHRCEHCSALWDQDINAASNLLWRYRQGEGQEPSASPAEPLTTDTV